MTFPRTPISSEDEADDDWFDGMEAGEPLELSSDDDEEDGGVLMPFEDL